MSKRLQPKRPAQVIVPSPARVSIPVAEVKKPEAPKQPVLKRSKKKGKAKKGKKVAKKRAARKNIENKEKMNARYFRFIDARRINNPLLLLQFIKWIAVPREVRIPKNRYELAEKIGIDKNTLSFWGTLPHFWDEVEIHRASIFRKFTSDIDYGLVKRARRGSAKEVELFHKLYEGYAEKLKVQEEPPAEALDPKDTEQIRHALANIGLKNIIRMNKFTDEDEDIPVNASADGYGDES